MESRLGTGRSIRVAPALRPRAVGTEVVSRQQALFTGMGWGWGWWFIAQVLGHPTGLEVSDADQVEEKVCSEGRDRRAPELSRSECVQPAEKGEQ